MNQTAVLFVNLGTPDAPEKKAVGRYLTQFLTDPDVIQIPALFRHLLVRCGIVPIRSGRSAHAYQKIWTKEGSPILVNTLEWLSAMRQEAGDLQFEMAMRYGNPSIDQALLDLKNRGVNRILLWPLYPQYSRSTTGSVIRRVGDLLKKYKYKVDLQIVNHFYQSEFFIEPSALLIRHQWKSGKFDHLLFSFHGLPESQIKRDDPTGSHCLSRSDCCDEFKKNAPNCYRAQTFATTNALVSELGLDSSQYNQSFQSRVGKTQWLTPYTDQLLVDLAKRGKKNLLVACPSFVTDNLETLEEISMQAKEIFINAGGQSLECVPSLNAEQTWVELFVKEVRKELENRFSVAVSLNG